MHTIKTNNYDQFHCIAGDCPQSCCLGWQIVIDDDSLEKYENFPGPFAGRLFNSIDWEEGCFKQCGRRCEMLNDDNLCDLQIEGGEEALCETCRRYPRHIEEFEGVREYSLSLSCPEAARIILSRRDHIEFTENDDDKEDDFEEFDYLLYTKLEDARDVIFEIIQDRTLGFDKKAGILTAFGRKLQEDLDRDALFDMDDTIEKFRGPKETLPQDDAWKKKKHFKMLSKLEVLNEEDWPVLVKNADIQWKDLSLTPEEEIQAEQLLMFFFYTYFCGAVYDDMIFSKVMLSVLSVYWIFQIDRAKEKGDLVTTAYTYAREVEHSDLNLDDLEEWMAKI